MTKAKKITAITLSCIFAVLSIFMIFWYFGESYGDFYSKATKEFEIAGLDEGFTPQGITYDETSKTFLTCGYMKNGSASRIYVVNAKNNATLKYFTLKNGENDYVGHSGGIATNGTNVWIVGDGTVLRFSFSEIENVKNGGSIDIIDSFDARNGADFATVEGEFLWIGEFQRDGKYDTDQSHFIETSSGETNKAVSFCFKINNEKDYGIDNTLPVKALSTPSLVQGMVVKENKVMISTSYSLPNSHFYTYENVFGNTDKTFNFNGTDIPLYFLENSNLTNTLEAPCMSEEIVIVNDKVFVTFESACQKYGFVTRESLRNVYSFDF